MLRLESRGQFDRLVYSLFCLIPFVQYQIKFMQFAKIEGIYSLSSLAAMKLDFVPCIG